MRGQKSDNNVHASHFHPELPRLCSRSEVSGHLVGHKIEIKWKRKLENCSSILSLCSGPSYIVIMGGRVAGRSGARDGNDTVAFSAFLLWCFPQSCRPEEGRTYSYFLLNSLFVFNQITTVSFDTFHLILLFFLVKSFDEGFEFLLDFANFLCKKHMNRPIFKLKITK